MKVERNGSEKNVDQISQKADRITRNLPPVMKNFDKEKSWTDILVKMGSIDKKVLTWTLAMAASLSMVIASNVVDWELAFDFFEQEQTEELAISQTMKPTVIDKVEGEKNFEGTVLDPMIDLEMQYVSINEPVDDHVTHTFGQDQIDMNDAVSTVYNPIRPYVNFGYQQSFAPELGFDVTVWKKSSVNSESRIGLGVSSQFAMTTSETGDTSVQPFAFFNVSFETAKANRNGWMTQASVLLNPDGNYYEDHALRLSFQKNITKHLRLGPQLIFVDSFRSVYPGITLTLI